LKIWHSYLLLLAEMDKCDDMEGKESKENPTERTKSLKLLGTLQ
tara:strand:- start:336 stop:467 length:132 start_codon:yes stop_codon:yes gene_type:complete